MQLSRQGIGSYIRRGFSFVELFGCVTALSGGLVLGLFYLDCDLEAVAVEAWEYVDTLESEAMASPADEANDEPTTTPSEQSGTIEEKTKSESETNKQVAQSQIVKQSKKSSRNSISGKGVATQLYWVALTNCMKTESNRRRVAARSGSRQLFDYLKYRKNGHEKAVATLEKIDEKNVDGKLRAHAQLVLLWHRAGAQLYSHAVDLVAESATANMTGPYAKSWNNAVTQHKMEEKLVLGKHASMAGYLNHSYKSQAPFYPAVRP